MKTFNYHNKTSKREDERARDGDVYVEPRVWNQTSANYMFIRHHARIWNLDRVFFFSVIRTNCCLKKDLTGHMTYKVLFVWIINHKMSSIYFKCVYLLQKFTSSSFINQDTVSIIKRKQVGEWFMVVNNFIKNVFVCLLSIKQHYHTESAYRTLHLFRYFTSTGTVYDSLCFLRKLI